MSDTDDSSAPVSLQVLTWNSEKTLRYCLASARGCAETLVIDGGSTDGTLEIARQKGVTVIPQPGGGAIKDFSAVRNIGLQAATQPWILALDSDEVLTPELRDEIYTIAGSAEPGAYLVPRQYVLPGGIRVDYASSYPNARVYFFHKSVCEKWIKPVHERPQLKPGTTVHMLKHPTLAPIGTPKDFREKNRRYLQIEAQRDAGKGYGHWLIHRVLHTLRSRLILTVRLLWIWLIPRKGIRLPLQYEMLRFWYGWRLIVITCPVARELHRRNKKQ